MCDCRGVFVFSCACLSESWRVYVLAFFSSLFHQYQVFMILSALNIRPQIEQPFLVSNCSVMVVKQKLS